MDGARLGRSSLRADAVYCALAAVVVIAFARPLAGPTGLPPMALALVGAVVLMWASLLWWGGRARANGVLSVLLRSVATLNAVAAIGLAAAGWFVPSVWLGILLVAVAAEVAAFAGSQVVALRRFTPVAGTTR